MIYPKRLIEADLPIRRISAHARAEKDSRLGHIPRLHIYPAARPVAACRAVLCAALWPDPVDFSQFQTNKSNYLNDKTNPNDFLSTARQLMIDWSHNVAKNCSDDVGSRLIAVQNGYNQLDNPIALREVMLDFISEFSKWENSSDPRYISLANSMTQAAHKGLGGEDGTRPLVVDPFAGGGAIPLEALRIGADAFSSDLNPVAVLIQKTVLEYIPQFGPALSDELFKWLDWIREPAQKALSCVYPSDKSGAKPVAYLWARTVLSEAPQVSGQLPVEIPMLTTMWLARQKNRKRALRWVRDSHGNVKTESITITYANGTTRKVRRPLLEIFEPKSSNDVERGTASRNAATCPVTGHTTPAPKVEQQLKSRKGGAKDARLYCVVIDADGESRDFRLPTKADVEAVNRADHLLQEWQKNHKDRLTIVPDEPVPVMSGVFNAPLYGHTSWDSLFTSRQLLAIAAYSKLAKEYVDSLSSKGTKYQEAVGALLGLAVDRLADLNSSLCGWQLNTPNSAHTFTRWALPMMMDFGEVNPLAAAGGSPESAVRRTIAYIRDAALKFPGTVEVQLCSANKHPLPVDSVSLFATDPPYYNAIPYSDLADFFYVWLRRCVGKFFPSLFHESTTPKEEEVCEMAGWDPVRFPHKDKAFFEREMTLALKRGREMVRDDGLALVVFAHKSTSGWEAMLQALVDAGWIITASWPIDTEMESRSRARNSATLASSVHLVCRPRENPDEPFQSDDIGDWRDILKELPRRIHEWMPRLAKEGVVGADAIFACLGPALEIFSRYARVEKASGEVVKLQEYLEHVWAAVAKEALTMIFTSADATGFEEDARLTAMWLWTLKTGDANGNTMNDEDSDDDDTTKKSSLSGFILEYDAARKIAQGLGAHLETLNNVVKIAGETARLIPVAERAAYLFGKNEGNTASVRKKKKPQLDLFKGQIAESNSSTFRGIEVSHVGNSILDRIHQSMILFASGRGEALRRFLVDDGVGTDQQFWRLAQALSALYPGNTDEKRWVDGVLARKKGLGL